MAELNLEPYAAEVIFQLRGINVNDKWHGILADFMNSIAVKCEKAGAVIIGHIKGLVRGEKSYLKISVTSASRPADVEGNCILKTNLITMDLNVIVYGLSFEVLDNIVKETAGDSEKGEVVDSVKVNPVQNNSKPVDIQLKMETNH